MLRSLRRRECRKVCWKLQDIIDFASKPTALHSILSVLSNPLIPKPWEHQLVPEESIPAWDRIMLNINLFCPFLTQTPYPPLLQKLRVSVLLHCHHVTETLEGYASFLQTPPSKRRQTYLPMGHEMSDRELREWLMGSIHGRKWGNTTRSPINSLALVLTSVGHQNTQVPPFTYGEKDAFNPGARNDASGKHSQTDLLQVVLLFKPWSITFLGARGTAISSLNTFSNASMRKGPRCLPLFPVDV